MVKVKHTVVGVLFLYPQLYKGNFYKFHRLVIQ